jgi:hypothetical protein
MEVTMSESKTPTQDMSALVSESVEKARTGMENYLRFFEKSMSISPWASTELGKKLTDYAQQNVDTAFGFAQQLTQAKNPQDLIRIQTEFFQSQLKALTEQVKDFGETATKVAASSLKGPSNT